MSYEQALRKLDLETFGEPDASKVARPVRGWGRAVRPGLHHTTRANAGWRATAATLKECTVEFEMVFKPSDAGFTAIRNAWLNNSEISLAIISEDPDTTGAEGPCGNFSITNFSRSEPLEEAIVVQVTAKLSAWGHWYTKAA